MKNLKEFSDAGTPLLEDFGVAAPSLTDATKTLTPFSEALTVALKSLGTAGEQSGPVFAQADPVVKKASTLAKTGVIPTRELAALFGSLEETQGWQRLTELIYNSAGAFNGFDSHGHFGRALVTLSTCLKYEPNLGGYSGCVARFNGPNSSSGEEANASVAALAQLLEEVRAKKSGGAAAEVGSAESATSGLGAAEPIEGAAPAERDRLQGEREEEAGLGEATETEGGTEPLLDYLLGQ
jgi:hypothetical protein